MATVQDVVLELTNNRNFYEAFTCVLRTAYENKYKFRTHDASYGTSFRDDMMSEITRYYKSRPFGVISKNNRIIAELVSHYSEECFGFYVPQDQTLAFMTDGWKLSTHEELTPFQKRGWTKGDKFQSDSGRIFTLRSDDGSDMPAFEVQGESNWMYVSLDDLTKIDDSTADDTNAVYMRHLTHAHKNILTISKIYKFVPHDGEVFQTTDEQGGRWTSVLSKHTDSWKEVPEHEYLKQEGLAKKQDIPNYKEGYRQAKKIAQYMHNYGASQQTIDKLTGDKPMNPSNIIKTKIIVFGDDAADLTDNQLFGKVESVEAEIERLDSVKNKPKKLDKKIADMKAALDELIKYIDSRP